MLETLKCRRIGFLVFLVFISGCSGSAEDQQPEQRPPDYTPQEFLADYRAVALNFYCHRDFECIDTIGHRQLSNATAFGSLEACLEKGAGVVTDAAGEQFAYFIDRLDTLQLYYDEQSATRCIESLDATDDLSCAERFPLSPSDLDGCGSVFVGRLDEGDACLTSAECTEGRCVPESGQCYGHCEAPPAEYASAGEACSADLPCEPHALCLEVDGGERRCVGYRSREEGESCLLSSFCKEGLYCAYDDCAPIPDYRDEGESCDDSAQCLPWLNCLDNNAGESTCRAPVGEGEDCSNDVCGYHLYCDDSDTCALRKGAGEECQGSDCKIGMQCEYDDSTGESQCMTYGSNGDDDAECEVPGR